MLRPEGPQSLLGNHVHGSLIFFTEREEVKGRAGFRAEGMLWEPQEV
jgi:hypothetical protein